MKRHGDIESKIEETLSSLDGIQKAGPGHFFFTRVKARLENEPRSGWDIITGFLAKPIVAGAIVAVVIATNLIAVYQESSKNNIAAAERTDISLLEDYSRQVVLIYENENVEP